MNRIRIHISTQFGRKFVDATIHEGETEQGVIDRVLNQADEFQGGVTLLKAEAIPGA